MKVRQGEQFAAVKERIRKYLDVSEKDFEKVGIFCFCGTFFVAFID